MTVFRDFQFAWTYDVAGWVRRFIFNPSDDGLLNILDPYGPTEDNFIQRALKPAKFTHLHALVDYAVGNDIEYTLSKGGDDHIIDLLKVYETSFDDIDTFRKEHSAKANNLWSAYTQYLQDRVYERVLGQVTEEVFTILFPDRELLLRLNENIAEVIRPLKVADHSQLLESDGVVHRCNYWPRWLQQGIFYRDKGRCCLCFTDLSGLFATGTEMHLDHVVPLHLGGTNDPTNLQLLCGKCNISKGKKSGRTSRKQLLFWNSDDDV